MNKLKIRFIFLGLLGIGANSFRLNSISPATIQKINEKIYEQYDRLGEYKGYFEPNMFSTIHHITDKPRDVYKELTDTIEIMNQNVGKESVKLISSALPHVDSIGHQILHANNVYINNILNNPNIPHDIQKMLILASIKLAQYGDDMGSELLKLYYNIVDSCL
tara:strand:- start:1 stop:489 length:489 start_codon:yes stop_codon:yes gene_type:complete